MSEVKKCPKCSGKMEEGRGLGGIAFVKKGDLVGDRIIPYYCKNCGFIELYKKMKENRS